MAPPMRVCVLEDGYEDSISPLKEVDPPADPAHYLPDHACERRVLTRANAVRRVIELSSSGRDSAGQFDLYLNLCDGAWDEDRPGIEVVQTLERLGVPFTGAASDFYEPSRENMKMVCRYAGVGTPDALLCRSRADLLLAAERLRFPLIPKHPSSYSSIGLTRRSRVTSARDLLEVGSDMISRFGATLVEEFIDGREFTVLVAENAADPSAPFVYQPVEFTFPPGETFKHFDLKWVTYSEMGCVPCSDADLDGALRDAARKLFVGLRGTGYGRCDIRVDAHDNIFVLEINPNCGVFYPPSLEGSADFILKNDPEGHAGFAQAIFAAAFKRRDERRRNWEVRYAPGSGYGIYATEPIEKDALVLAYESTGHVLVSRSYAQAVETGSAGSRNGHSQNAGWFSRYAYPLSDNVYVTWDPDPSRWRPINHSCNPNSWLCGLDVHARRAIRAGEEITIDYATFCNETMSPFVCTCGSPECRGIIRGTDYKEAFVRKYGDHVSDYVRAKREARGPKRVHKG